MEVTGNVGFSSSQLDSYSLRSSEFDLFDTPRYNKDVIQHDQRYFYPAKMDDDAGPFEILITGNGTQFMQMHKARLEIWLEYLVKDIDTGTERKLHDKDDASVVPFPASSFFKDVRVKMAHMEVPELTQNLYAYKSYIENLFETTLDNRDTYFRSQVGLIDIPGLYDRGVAWKDWGSYTNGASKLPPRIDADGKPDKDEVRRQEIWQRKDYMLDNNPCFISSPLHLDFLSQHKCFPPNLSMSLVFERNYDTFVCLSKTPQNEAVPRLRIDKMRIAVPCVSLHPDLSTKLLSSWNTRPISYYYQHVQPRTFHLAQGSQFWEERDISHGVMPKSLFIVFVKTANYNGRFTHSPFQFENLGITRFELTRDGQVMNKFTVEPDFGGKKDGFEAYNHFLRNTKKEKENSNITLTEYKQDYTIFSFDLTNDFNNNFNLYEPQFGTLGVNVKFPTLDTSYVAIAFFVYTKSLTLDKDLRVSVTDI
jgi:hypothetical protein